jgi:antitoxin component YwqK of YwqJK toxin-antitoxin module
MDTVPLRGTGLFRGASLLALLLIAGAAQGAQDCELNGASVNPDNGSTYAGKTGIMKCVDRETRKFLREEEYRNGRAIGYRKNVDMFGKTVIGHYNEQGNRDGEFKELDAEGNLVSEERYANSSQVGVQTQYYKNKQVKRRAFAEPPKGTLASIEYNERGQIMQLRCADKPLLGDDRALCGFDGKPSDVTFYTAKGDVAGNARYENGKRLTMTALNTQGAVARSEEIKGERRVLRENYPEGALRLETVVIGNAKQSERELAKSGQPVRETRWQDGWKADETLWYLNGQQKSKTRWERDGDHVLVKADEFWDNGKLRARTVRDERRGYVGVQQAYTESGALENESTYEQFKLTRKKGYKDGRLVIDEEYFEDGSRKSVRN